MDQVNEAKNSVNVSDESPRTAPESSREWIEKRYGRITVSNQSIMFGGDDRKFEITATVVIAAVPVMGGIAIGAGQNEEYAINALRFDLHMPAASEQKG